MRRWPPTGSACPRRRSIWRRLTPTISAADLYANARRDYNSGKVDLALQEFADYLRWYGNTELAPNAQFYVAMAHYNQKNYEDAAKEFDMVLEKYGDNNNKSGEALYYKGKSLVNSGRKTQGASRASLPPRPGRSSSPPQGGHCAVRCGPWPGADPLVHGQSVFEVPLGDFPPRERRRKQPQIARDRASADLGVGDGDLVGVRREPIEEHARPLPIAE